MSQAIETHQPQQGLPILSLLSLLIDYPSQTLFDGHDELNDIIGTCRLLSPNVREKLQYLLDALNQDGILESQSKYDGLFDRGRSLSLLLFEHVHGESRDRGQAMVDLINQYREHGFTMSVKELPDYIPLYLEFLSTQDEVDARVGLADVSHILALLSARLTERQSLYAACFDALLQLAGQSVDTLVGEAQVKIKDETPDHSLLALDKEWEEEVVDFLDAKQEDRCKTNAAYPSDNKRESATPGNAPKHWVGFNQGQHSANTTSAREHSTHIQGASS